MLNIFFLTFILYTQNVYSLEVININVAVSSNFLSTFRIISNNFEKKFNCKINISSDSTANLYKKIINKAPFDIFISADSIHPLMLENFSNNKSFIYARGFIVLFNSKINIKKNIFRFFQKFKYLSIANKNLSPYGHATFQLVYNLNIYNQYQVNALNINQSYYFINTNNKCIGFIALSQAYHGNISKNLIWKMPSYLYSNIEQRMICLKSCENNYFVSFIKYINSYEVKKLMSFYGYKVYDEY